MAHACNPRTWGTLKTGSSVWGQLWLHPEFQASLGATTVPTPAETCTWQSEQGTQQTYWEQKESRAVWDRQHPGDQAVCSPENSGPVSELRMKDPVHPCVTQELTISANTWIDAQGWCLNWMLLPVRTENNLNARSLKWYYSKKIEYSSYVPLH